LCGQWRAASGGGGAPPGGPRRPSARLGLVQPSRAPGKARRYSQRDVDLLQRIQQLSQEGVSLEGIRRIIELEEMVEEHRDHIARLQAQLEDAHAKLVLAVREFADNTRGARMRRAGTPAYTP